MAHDWWKTFFSGNWLDVQRNMRAKRTKDEVEFLQKALNVEPPGRILDIPCGNGRRALPLAERGFQGRWYMARIVGIIVWLPAFDREP